MTKRRTNAEITPEISRRLLVDIVRGKALELGLKPELMMALVEQESGWNPWMFYFDATQYRQKIAPLYTMEKLKNDLTELQARATSWGLMQVFGQAAREHDFAGPYLTELCQPNVGVELGCRIFREKLDHEHGDVVRALLSYKDTGRASYADEVLARKASYESGEQKQQENST